jgi:O-antigen/teichoic acid export membrane protein
MTGRPSSEGPSNVAARITSHTLISATHGLVSIAALTIMARVLFRHLGVEFGVFTLVTGSMLRLNLLEESVGSYLVTTVSGTRRPGASQPAEESPGLDPRARIGAAVATALGAALLTATGLSVALYLLLGTRPDAIAIATLAGAGLLAAALASIGTRVLEGCEAYLTLRTIQLLGAILLLAATLWLVDRGAGLEQLVLLHLCYHAARAVVMIAFARARSSLALLGCLFCWRRAAFADLGAFVRPLLTARLVAVISYRLDLWFVQIIAGPAASAAYAVAETIGNVLLHSLELFKVLLPVSVRDWREDEQWIRGFVIGTTKVSMFVAGSACLASWAALDVILLGWFGTSSELTYIASGLLILFAASTTMRSVPQVILIGQQKFSVLQSTFIWAGSINVVCSLAATLAFGGWGPALGTAIAGGFLLLSVHPRSEGALGLATGSLRRGVLLPGVAVFSICAALGASRWSLLLWATAALWWRTLAELGVLQLVFAALFFAFVLTKDERQWLRGRLRRGGR